MSVSTLNPRMSRHVAQATPRRGTALFAKVRAACIRVRERFGRVLYAAPMSVLQPEHLFVHTREEDD